MNNSLAVAGLDIFVLVVDIHSKSFAKVLNRKTCNSICWQHKIWTSIKHCSLQSEHKTIVVSHCQAGYVTFNQKWYFVELSIFKHLTWCKLKKELWYDIYHWSLMSTKTYYLWAQNMPSNLKRFIKHSGILDTWTL